ncbi:putative MFS family arabinose efflux permease [Propionicimonas paludicola]|uniref:Putative MFS family arabinose efflux permease n=1 Tax=Propionicimonas paludicola TaxID=185243 RepID=A0A2A9CPR6_9ACTN|nr:MFS transporter [Propionicimonas paludicola]PFG15602.1 putative MFS family arabinose efflux permease [Propionicimonas paludicola]
MLDEQLLAPVEPKQRPWWAGGFGRLLFGQSVSAVGSQVTFMALPMIAVLSLGATPAAMGLLGAVDNLPYLLIGLWVGVYVDRYSRRRLMVLSDLLRAVAVVSVPIAAIGGWLSFVQLCVVAFVVGIGNIVFDVACQAQLPELVPSERLVGANGALQTAGSLSMVGAPGLVGVLIKVIGAPISMLIDAGSYLVSAISVGSIRTPEQHRPSEETSTWEQVVQGWRLVRADARLIGIGGGLSMISIAMNAAFAVLMFYLVNSLKMDAGMVGLVFVAFGVGGAIGAMTISPLAGRVGTGTALVVSPLVGAAGLAALTASDWGLAPTMATIVVFTGAVVMGAGLLGFSVLGSGVRQLLAPEQARGRVLGTLRFIELGSMPLGSVIGGVVGERFGAPAAIWLSAVLLCAAVVWVLATPLRSLRELPTD